MAELEDLKVEECLEHLEGAQVGRVGMMTPVGPRVLPVNFAMHDGDIVFRTAPHSELGSYAWDADVAFEVDDLDFENHRGWSVLAIGTGQIIEDPEELDDIKQRWDPQPWASGLRHLYLKIVWRDLTGRRLVSAASATGS